MSKPQNIPLHEHETAYLIRHGEGRSLVLSFGPGWVALDPVLSAWALPILARLRGEVFTDGAGI